MPAAAARSIARLDGAPTAATIGMPAASAFWTSSKLARPLNISTPAATGKRPPSSNRPTSLSTALWRPTSSCTASSAPSSENSAAACSPPVLSKVACAARKAPGRPWITAAVTRAPASRRFAPPLSRPSSPARPQTPHAALVTNVRALAARAAAAAGPSSTRTVSSSICLRAPQIGAVRQHALRVQEADRQRDVVAGRAHGRRQRALVIADADPDLQRAFDRHPIARRRRDATAHAHHRSLQRLCVFHRRSPFLRFVDPALPDLRRVADRGAVSRTNDRRAQQQRIGDQICSMRGPVGAAYLSPLST